MPLIEPTLSLELRWLTKCYEELQRLAETSIALVDEDQIETSLAAYSRAAWPLVEPTTTLVWNWHLDAICEHLQAVTDGEIANLVITMPPRSGKSSTVSVMWPTWSWIKRPDMRWLFASYAQTLSTRDALRSRRVIQSHWYQLRWGDRFKLTGDQNQKCLAQGSQVLLADGSLRAIECMVPGDRISTVNNGKWVTDVVRHVWSNGVKPVYRIKLSDGAVVIATENHRFFGAERWQYVRDLQIGDPLAVGRCVPFGYTEVSYDDAFLLALWLAEGTKHATSFEVTTADITIVERLRMICLTRHWSMEPCGPYSYRLSADRQQTPDTPMGLLKRYLGTRVLPYGSRTRLAHQYVDMIRIPEKIMQAPADVQAIFLGTYIACDGCIHIGENKGITIHSASERLCRDFQLLLRRFQVGSTLHEEHPHYTYRQTYLQGKPSWRVGVMGADELSRLPSLDVFGKKEHLTQLFQWVGASRRHTGGRNASIPPALVRRAPRFKGSGGWASRRALTAYVHKHQTECADLKHLLEMPLDWRRIVQIERLPDMPTWHLETSETGTFIVDGILSHNTRYENDKTGYRIATSVGGSATGEGGSVIVCDDPHNILEIHSDTIREGVLLWWDEVMSSRLNDPKTGGKVIVQQRGHERDLAGHVLAQGGYVHLDLPMEYEPKTYSFHGREVDPRTEPGELLCPERIGPKEVDDLKLRLGPTAFAGQYNQKPVPAGGNIFKSWWWRYWQPKGMQLSPVMVQVPDGDLLAIAPEEVPGTFDEVIQSWDMAFKDLKDSDYVSGLVWGKKGANKYLLDRAHDRMDFVKTQKALRAMSAKWPHALAKLVEDKANGPAIIASLKQEIAGLIAVEPDGDKVARAYAVTPTCEAGNVFLPHPSLYPWVSAYRHELETFPNAANDDDVDATTQALKRWIAGSRWLPVGT